MPITKYSTAKKKYFDGIGSTINIYVNNTDTSFLSTESQLQMLKFEDALERCIDCEQSWFVKDTLDFWYPNFRNWINEKNCARVPNGMDPFQKVIHPGIFLSCLKEWINDDYFGKIYSEDIKFSDDGW